MRTTIDIPDPTYRQLKAKAASEGRTVKAVLLEAAEQVLSPGARAVVRRVALPLVRSKRPGALELDNARIYDVISFP